MKKKILVSILLIASTLFLSASDVNVTDYTNNFYKAVNKQWLDTHTIPKDKSSVSTFTDIDDTFIKNSQAMMAALIKKEKRSADEQKIVDYYTSYADMKNRNDKGVQPLKPFFEHIDTIKSYPKLAKVMAEMSYEGVPTPYGFGLLPDAADATKYVIVAVQSGMGLQKKFYDDNSTVSLKKRKDYTDYVSEYLSLAKFNDVNKTLANNMKVENILAKYSNTITEMMDVKLTNNPMDFKTFNTMFSEFDMPYYFKRYGYPTDMKINVMTPKFFKGLNKMFKEIPLETWKDYLKTQLVMSWGGYLSDDFIQAAHRYSVKEGLASTLEPLEIRAIRETSDSLKYLYGKIYVKTYFNEEIKSTVETILKNILAEYKMAITNTDRFSESTKKAALLKIEKMAFNIAYPNKWQDYSSYKTKNDDLIFNIKELIKLAHKRDAEKLKRGTVDNDLWESNAPQEVNAFYSAMSNKFVVLAGILHAPIFDINNSDAANYGGIGMVIGHEIGHAFDQRGAQYDEKGNLKNWWTKEDLKKFTALNDALIAQADAYEITPGVHANGKLEIGEIQADLSGVEIALRAYLRTLKDDKKTREQGIKDFYIQFAKTWKSKSLQQTMIMQNDSDGHPVAEYRINGTVKNMDQFYEAFGVKKGDGMYLSPEKRVHIWTEKNK